MSHLKSNRKGWEKLKKKLMQFGERQVDVGFFSKDRYGPERDNMYVAEVAYINDQGNSQVPPRPFLTVDFEAYVRKHFAGDARNFFKNLLQSTRYRFVADLRSEGNDYANELKNIIYDYPGSNSPAWAAHKGFDDPLFYTGTMVDSVDYRVRKGKSEE